MIAFEVSINGKRRYVAGHQDARILTLWVNGSVSNIPGIPISLGILGTVAVPAATDGQFETLLYPRDPLSVGDEIVIRVVDADRADEPRKPDDDAYRIEFGTTA
jgi:hypothetical protein